MRVYDLCKFGHVLQVLTSSAITMYSYDWQAPTLGESQLPELSHKRVALPESQCMVD